MGTELARQDQTTALVTGWSGPQLPSSLVTIVGDNLDYSYAMKDVVGPDENAAMLAIIPEWERSLEPCPPEEVAKMMAGVALLHPDLALSDREQSARLKLYIKHLSDIPQDILSEAFGICTRTIKFFPKVAEVRSAAAKEIHRRVSILFGMKQLTLKHRLEWRPPPDAPPLEEDVAETNAVMRKMGLKTRFRPDGSPYELAEGDEDPAPEPQP